MSDLTKTSVEVDGELPWPLELMRCQQEWDALQPTEREDVRQCDRCNQRVHRVDVEERKDIAIAMQECIMVSGKVKSSGQSMLLLGIPAC